MSRLCVENADLLLDKEIKVLDHGFVKLVDHMGDDNRIIKTARISYAGKGTKGFRGDQQLINYLMRKKHTSPFEQVIFTFHVKLPLFVARQWIRHRTARVNEMSARYSILEPDFYLPSIERINIQSNKNKQCNGEKMPFLEAKDIIERMKEQQIIAYQYYMDLINSGVTRELARINLPLSIYTQWYWQMDLKNLFNFLSLRLHKHAQWEIRQYANVIADCVKIITPIAYEAFENFILNDDE